MILAIYVANIVPFSFSHTPVILHSRRYHLPSLCSISHISYNIYTCRQSPEPVVVLLLVQQLVDHIASAHQDFESDNSGCWRLKFKSLKRSRQSSADTRARSNRKVYTIPEGRQRVPSARGAVPSISRPSPIESASPHFSSVGNN